MWAMQDYIQQYQGLVCQFRSENASLRRQLNEMRTGTVVERGPQPAPRTPNSPPATNSVPKFQDSPAPSAEMPDVPPLGQGTSIDANNRYLPLAENEKPRVELSRYAQLASYETPANSMAAQASERTAPDKLSAAARANSTTPDATAVISPDILLSGEVVANDSGGGPRLAIDIESFDQAGSNAKFDGNANGWAKSGKPQTDCSWADKAFL